MKKFLSILLALTLVCGTAALAVNSLFSMDAGRDSNTVTVSVTLNEDISAENATMLQGELYYDPEVLKPVSVMASDAYGFLTCIISQREPRVQFNCVSQTSEPLALPAGTVVTAEFEALSKMDAELQLEMDLQSADGAVVVDLTEYVSVVYEGDDACTEHEWDGLVCVRCGAVRENPFTDTKEASFYFKPMMWAVDNGITNGITPTTFCPDDDLQRAQVVVMLWRAAGKPEPKRSENPFTDVAEGRYYYKAVLWAVEEGITQGITDTTFGPDEPTTRAQAVTFLWRYLGKPEAAADTPFHDVLEKGFYYKAVAWAVENGITKGMTATEFGINVTCSRGHMVTFVYRALN